MYKVKAISQRGPSCLLVAVCQITDMDYEALVDEYLEALEFNQSRFNYNRVIKFFMGQGFGVLIAPLEKYERKYAYSLKAEPGEPLTVPKTGRGILLLNEIDGTEGHAVSYADGKIYNTDGLGIPQTLEQLNFSSENDYVIVDIVSFTDYD